MADETKNKTQNKNSASNTAVLENELSDIRKKIEELALPPSVYAGVEIKHGTLDLTVGGRENLFTSAHDFEREPNAVIASCFESYARQSGNKVVAAGVVGMDKKFDLISKLWLQQDIVSYFYRRPEKPVEKLGALLARKVEDKFDGNNIVKPLLGERNRVIVHDLVDLQDYEQTCSKADFQLAKHLAGKLKGKKILFISSTPQGGGVALMRHALLRLLKQLGVDASWHVMSDQAEIFDITKTKFHNVLQAVSNPDIILTEDDERMYGAWVKENAENLKDIFAENDVIIIDDPQPSGMIPYIKKANPKAYLIYRSHIQIESHLADEPGSPQYRTWQYLWNSIKQADCFVAHPIKDFIPKDVDPSKTVLMPAATDPLDGLNKPLDESQLSYYIKLFNKFLLENAQTPLDISRPYLVQIARFDPSKGIPDVIESFRKLRSRLSDSQMPLPQLVICGNGSVDDPDRKPIFNLTVEILNRPEYRAIKDDIKVARLPHVDQLLNAILRKALVSLQLSHKEGFEIKVTEALMKGVPVVAYKSGGIPLQIKHGVSGFLAETGNTDQVADYLYNLYTDTALRQEMSKNAIAHARKDVLTMSNTIGWLFLAGELIEKGKVLGNGGEIRELLKSAVAVK